MKASIEKSLITIVLISISLIGFFIIFIVTSQRGVGIKSDSVTYIYLARSLYDSSLLGKDFLPFITKGWQHYPPLFSSFLSAIHWISGQDPILASRWFNSALFGLNIFLLGFLIYKYTKTLWLTILGALWMLVKIDILNIHSVVMSEPLFIFLMLLWAAFFINYLNTPSTALLLGSSIAAALACMTRFAGLSLVLTGIILLLFDKKRSGPNSFNKVLIFASISLFPTILWGARNFLEGGRFIDPAFAFHPFVIGNLERCSWPVNGFSVPPLILSALTIILILMGCIFWKGKDRLAVENIPIQMMRFLTTAILFIIIYVVMWGIVIVFFDAMGTDSRYYLPIQIIGMLLFLGCLSTLFSVTKSPKFLRCIFVLLMSIYLIGINSISAAQWFVKRYNDGVMYSGKAWDKSEIIQEVSQISPHTVIYTNNFHALYIKANRQSIQLESKKDTMTLRRNPLYAVAMKKMKEDLQNKNGLIVYCSLMCEECGLPTIDELKKEIQLKRIVKVSDGEIYGWDDSK